MGLFSSKKEPNVLKVSFVEPRTLHPNSDEITIADLASILEHKYHLIEKFNDKYSEKIADRFTTLYLRAFEKEKDAKKPVNLARILRVLEQDIQEFWREFIVDAEHGLTTKASTERGSEPFIDTGAYFRNMRCIIEL